MSRSFFYWGAQNQTQYSRYGFISAEQKGRITSLNLLATLLLIQPMLPRPFFSAKAHCWLMFDFSLVPPKSLSAELLPRKFVLLQGAIPSQEQALALTFVDLHEVPVSPFLQSVLVLLTNNPDIQHTDVAPPASLVLSNWTIHPSWSLWSLLNTLNSTDF